MFTQSVKQPQTEPDVPAEYLSQSETHHGQKKLNGMQFLISYGKEIINGVYKNSSNKKVKVTVQSLHPDMQNG